MNYLNIAKARMKDEKYSERVFFEFLFNLLKILKHDLKKSLLLIRARAEEGAILLDDEYQEAECLWLEKWGEFKPAIGWRSKIYDSFKTNILKSGIDLLKQKRHIAELIGLICGLVEEIFEVKNSMPLFEDETEETNEGLPDLDELKKPFISSENSSVKSKFLRGYAKGLRFHRGDRSDDFFENSRTTTGYYLVLVVFGDVAESLESRPELFEFLKQIMGEENAPNWSAFERNMDRIGLLSEEHKASL